MNRTPGHRQQIQDQLASQIDTYSQAIEIASRLASSYDATPERQAELAQLNELMQRANQEQQVLLKLLEQCPNEEKGHPTTRELSSRLSRLVANLIDIFAAIEGRAMKVKEKLYPEVNESLRAQQMQAAYTVAQQS